MKVSVRQLSIFYCREESILIMNHNIRGNEGSPGITSKLYAGCFNGIISIERIEAAWICPSRIK